LIDPTSLDHEVRLGLAKFPPPQADLADVAAWRAAYGDYFSQRRSAATEISIDVVSTDFLVPSVIDGYAIPVRVYRPASGNDGRALLYMHASSFCLGGLELEDARCRMLADGARCIVVAVDYRLAPEHPFPVPLDDCDSVLRWMVDNAPALSVDPLGIGVGGCSAGGALAASLAIRTRRRQGPPVALQLLLYPVLDVSLSSRSIRTLCSEEELEDMGRMWRHYLGVPLDSAPELASPGSCALEAIPPTYICAAELDPLRDEAIAYAQRLIDLGVRVELHVWPRIPHAVDLFVPDAPISRETVEEQSAALARLFS
jgi:acetyl esterase